MKFFYLLLFFLKGSLSFANTLLIPGLNIKYEDYFQRCSTTEYFCTLDYFIELIHQRKTPLFDSVMDSTDLNSLEFIKTFQIKIVKILNSEDLDRTQLLMILALISQIRKENSTIELQTVEKELLNIKSILDNTSVAKDEKLISIFKHVLSTKEIQKIKTKYLKIPIYVLHFLSIPYRTNSFDIPKEATKSSILLQPLLSPPCGPSTLKFKVRTAKYCKKPVLGY